MDGTFFKSFFKFRIIVRLIYKKYNIFKIKNQKKKFNKMFKNLFSMRTLFKMSLIAGPITLTTRKYECSFWDKKKPNSMDERLHFQQINSNKPCEDRYDFRQLKNINAYVAAVYDGHGGWQVSELCRKVLLQYLDQCIQKNKNLIKDQQKLITTSLHEAFKLTQEEFINAARTGYKYGFGRFSRAGSCVLVCLVHNNKVYTANAGDSLGILIEEGAGIMKYTQINRQLNANKPSEQQRLKKAFPNEQDIVICKKQNNQSCYVKGRLQPTRSLGDLRLKHSQFNNPQNYPPQNDYQAPLKNFSGNYITWQPQISVFELTRNHKSIVMATDGLWDQLERQEVAEISKGKEVKLLPTMLISRALEKAAQSAGMTLEELERIPKGKTRKIHDDITVIVLDLQNQYQ